MHCRPGQLAFNCTPAATLALLLWSGVQHKLLRHCVLVLLLVLLLKNENPELDVPKAAWLVLRMVLRVAKHMQRC
jgi:hypothetical protein